MEALILTVPPSHRDFCGDGSATWLPPPQAAPVDHWKYGARCFALQALTKAPIVLLTNPRIDEQLFQFEPREVRRILVGTYEIRYELQDSIIYILRLWHTREER